MIKTFSLTLNLLLGCSIVLIAQDNTKGYYKDLFVDGGIYLTSRNNLPAARFLNLSMEAFICSPQEVDNKVYYNHSDSLLQEQISRRAAALQDDLHQWRKILETCPDCWPGREQTCQ